MNDKQLESLLRDADHSAPPVEKRADLAGCVRQIERRRHSRSRRLKQSAAFSACYLAGIATAWLLFSATQPQTRDEAAGQSAARRSHPKRAEIDNRIPSAGQLRRNPETPRDKATAPSLETVAGESRYEWFRQLGNESRLRNDLPTAVAYYGQALAAATDEELQISYDRDDWLLISLKKDRATTSDQPQPGDSI